MRVRLLAVVLMLAGFVHPVIAGDKAKKEQPCRATFKVTWSDGGSDGMNAPQLEWWDKHGRKHFPGICYAADNPGIEADWTVQLQMFRGESSGVGGTGKVIVGSGGTHTKIFYVVYHNGKREATGSDSSTWEMSEENTYYVALEKGLLAIDKLVEKSGRNRN